MPRRKCTQKRCSTKRKSKKITGSIKSFLRGFMPQTYHGEKASLPMMSITPRTNARYKKRTTHRSTKRKTRFNYDKYSEGIRNGSLMVPTGAIPAGNGLYRVVPPN